MSTYYALLGPLTYDLGPFCSSASAFPRVMRDAKVSLQFSHWQLPLEWAREACREESLGHWSGGDSGEPLLRSHGPALSRLGRPVPGPAMCMTGPQSSALGQLFLQFHTGAQSRKDSNIEQSTISCNHKDNIFSPWSFLEETASGPFPSSNPLLQKHRVGKAMVPSPDSTRSHQDTAPRILAITTGLYGARLDG